MNTLILENACIFGGGSAGLAQEKPVLIENDRIVIKVQVPGAARRMRSALCDN